VGARRARARPSLGAPAARSAHRHRSRVAPGGAQRARHRSLRSPPAAPQRHVTGRFGRPGGATRAPLGRSETAAGEGGGTGARGGLERSNGAASCLAVVWRHSGRMGGQRSAGTLHAAVLLGTRCDPRRIVAGSCRRALRNASPTEAAVPRGAPGRDGDPYGSNSPAAIENYGALRGRGRSRSGRPDIHRPDQELPPSSPTRAIGLSPCRRPRSRGSRPDGRPGRRHEAGVALAAVDDPVVLAVRAGDLAISQPNRSR
jgi:hypothetical protein